jgi:hypothetical protein
MNKDMIVRRLRPFLSKRFQCVHQPLNFARPLSSRDATHDFEKRIVWLEDKIPRSEWYPRLPTILDSSKITKSLLETQFAQLAPDQTNEEQKLVLIGTINWHCPRSKTAAC